MSKNVNPSPISVSAAATPTGAAGATTINPLNALNPEHLMIDTYNPKNGPIEAWIVRFNRALRTDEVLKDTKWPSEVLFQVLANRLDGGAAIWYGNILATIDASDHRVEFLQDLLLNSCRYRKQQWCRP